jgi:hypothetical protein
MQMPCVPKDGWRTLLPLQLLDVREAGIDKVARGGLPDILVPALPSHFRNFSAQPRDLRR